MSWLVFSLRFHFGKFFYVTKALQLKKNLVNFWTFSILLDAEPLTKLLNFHLIFYLNLIIFYGLLLFVELEVFCHCCKLRNGPI